MSHIPGAVYRLNFSPKFPFSSASTLSRYFSTLGITDIYASPVFSAKKGSTHGYDITDHNAVNTEIGGEPAFIHLAWEMKDHGISWIQDFVPNHMVYDPENRMISDLFMMGRFSEYYSFFDCDYGDGIRKGTGKILYPLLDTYYWGSLINGDISLHYGESGLNLMYKDITIPLLIDSYYPFFSHRSEDLESRVAPDDPDIITFKGVLQSMNAISLLQTREMRLSLFNFIKKTLWDLYDGSPEFKQYVDDNIIEFNGNVADAGSFDLLHSLLLQQVYRLSYWKVATEEINYRRFFTINSLISLRIEDEPVFSEVHGLIFRLVHEGWVSGLRIDHIDGLYDPLTYLTRIKHHCPDVYLVVEKILGMNENLPEQWPVDGTTGYDFCNMVNGLFCLQSARKRIDSIYRSFTGRSGTAEELISEKKRFILEKHMAGDIENLALLLKNLSDRMREGSDITLFGMKKGLLELIAAFPVYRTYISSSEIRPQDKDVIEEAFRRAQGNYPDFFHEFDFIRSILLQTDVSQPTDGKAEILEVIMKFQQYTGVAMAKGFEDSALYSYNRLLSLNEVGADLAKFGISLDEFHLFNERRARSYPHTLNTTTTHDTKRGEDVRARINVLSEIPREWESTIRKWAANNRKYWTISLNTKIPSANDEYLLYQTLVGTYPVGKDDPDGYFSRIIEYAIKATREAKDHTTWIKPDVVYESGYLTFLKTIFDPAINENFIRDVEKFSEKVALYGIVNSLSQTILKITSPGIPDFYQGTETWALCLVDPDNRREVDFSRRIKMLQDIIEESQKDPISFLDELCNARTDGRIKLYVLYRLLWFRNSEKALFIDGDYIPLYASGPLSDHIISFVRKKNERYAITMVPRFTTGITEEKYLPLGEKVWKKTFLKLPDGYPTTWIDVISGIAHEGMSFSIGNVFCHFPGAVLVNRK
jgi:(1->4)-alpha-D-glucan 1-alpha-D-glucosylmutase